MKRIVFIADDLGASPSINAAVFYAHLHGVLDGAALMPGQAATDAAIARAREVPSLAIGWHVHLADSRPCTLDRWPWHRSLAGAGIALALSPRVRRLVRNEIRAQWQVFEQSGLTCAFVSGHHHLHVHPFVRRVIAETLPSGFKGWIRWGAPRYFGDRRIHTGPSILHHLLQMRGAWPYEMSTTLWGLDRLESMQADEVAAVLPSLGEGLHEFMFHPRRIEGDRDTRCLLALRCAAQPPDTASARGGG